MWMEGVCQLLASEPGTLIRDADAPVDVQAVTSAYTSPTHPMEPYIRKPQPTHP